MRDYAEVRASGRIDARVAAAALDLFEVDPLGLDKLDLACCGLCGRFGGGPVGISTLATSIGEEPDTVEDVAEPYLLQLGFLQRTPRGRVATPAALNTSAWRCPGARLRLRTACSTSAADRLARDARRTASPCLNAGMGEGKSG